MEQKRNNNWLAEHREKSVSQFGEEGVLKKIFEVIGEKNRWCVEFGAIAGTNDSTTWNLINNKGWSGVCIEAHPMYYKKLVDTYKDIDRVICMNEYVAFEGKNILDNLLKKTKIPVAFDFLSIDIDGNDYHVWEAVQHYQPRVVMIEYNGRIPADMEFVQPRDMKIRWGSSLASLAKLGKKKGYELVYAYTFNAIFVKKELFDSFGIVDNSPTALAEGDLPDTRFFQLFDGSIVLYGCDKIQLLAHKKKILKKPVWHLTSKEFYPVEFKYDRTLTRIMKEMIKNSFLYPLVYPYAQKRYNRIWKKKKKQLTAEKDQ